MADFLGWWCTPSFVSWDVQGCSLIHPESEQELEHEPSMAK